MSTWRTWSDSELEAWISANENSQDEHVIDTIDRMERELQEREEFRSEQPDTPSLQDQGIELGSYGA